MGKIKKLIEIFEFYDGDECIQKIGIYFFFNKKISPFWFYTEL